MLRSCAHACWPEADSGGGAETDSEFMRSVCNFCDKAYSRGWNNTRQHLVHDHDITRTITGASQVAKCNHTKYHLAKASNATLPDTFMEFRQLCVLHEELRNAALDDRQRVVEHRTGVAEALGGGVPGSGVAPSGGSPLDSAVGAWVQAIAVNALSWRLFDDPFFRAALTATTSVPESAKWPHRDKVSTTSFAQLHCAVRDSAAAVFDTEKAACGYTLLSDGWERRGFRTYLNFMVVADTRSLYGGMVDCGSTTKTADWIAAQTMSVVRGRGREQPCAVVMDGACRSTLSKLEELLPGTLTLVCTAHGVNLWMGDSFKQGSHVMVSVSNVYVAIPDAAKQLFAVTKDKAAEVVKIMTRSRALCNLFREFCGSFTPVVRLDLVHFCETRFASVALVFQRLMRLQQQLQMFMCCDMFEAWKSKSAANQTSGETLRITLMSTTSGCTSKPSPASCCLRSRRCGRSIATAAGSVTWRRRRGLSSTPLPP